MDSIFSPVTLPVGCHCYHIVYDSFDLVLDLFSIGTGDKRQSGTDQNGIYL